MERWIVVLIAVAFATVACPAAAEWTWNYGGHLKGSGRVERYHAEDIRAAEDRGGAVRQPRICD